MLCVCVCVCVCDEDADEDVAALGVSQVKGNCSQQIEAGAKAARARKEGKGGWNNCGRHTNRQASS